MGFRTEYSLSAEADLDALSRWLIERQAEVAGRRWLEGLQKAVDTLTEMPERCPLMRKDPRISFEVRQLFYGKKPHIFRVLFRLEGDTVYILRIRRGRQDAVLLH